MDKLVEYIGREYYYCVHASVQADKIAAMQNTFGAVEYCQMIYPEQEAQISEIWDIWKKFFEEEIYKG